MCYSLILQIWFCLILSCATGLKVKELALGKILVPHPVYVVVMWNQGGSQLILNYSAIAANITALKPKIREQSQLNSMVIIFGVR